MPDLYIREYTSLARDAHGHVAQAGEEPATAGQVISGFTASAQSAAFHDATQIVRVISDGDCWLDFGENPSATKADGAYLPANTPAFFGVRPGDKVAAYDGVS
jgi:hypothetical protein